MAGKPSILNPRTLFYGIDALYARRIQEFSVYAHVPMDFPESPILGAKRQL
jgi:hypothetical protein